MDETNQILYESSKYQLYNIEHIQNNQIKKRVQDIDNSLWKADKAP